mmetsp:Transcript_27981/g.88897  ORF Transcript_27981/g.88897 Transcript_27981/m.88897 type:complete len:231 (-) Transcript_27981:119-811(-)
MGCRTSAPIATGSSGSASRSRASSRAGTTRTRSGSTTRPSWRSCWRPLRGSRATGTARSSSATARSWRLLSRRRRRAATPASWSFGGSWSAARSTPGPRSARCSTPTRGSSPTSAATPAPWPTPSTASSARARRSRWSACRSGWTSTALWAWWRARRRAPAAIAWRCRRARRGRCGPRTSCRWRPQRPCLPWLRPPGRRSPASASRRPRGPAPAARPSCAWRASRAPWRR